MVFISEYSPSLVIVEIVFELMKRSISRVREKKLNPIQHCKWKNEVFEHFQILFTKKDAMILTEFHIKSQESNFEVDETSLRGREI
jgi:hypothetical protein